MKLLVVEDNQRIADSIKQGLETQKNIVDVAYDGDTGLDLALAEQYDVIILDRMLPGVDGMQIIQSMREESISIPVLMLTAKNEVSDRIAGLEAGADDYLGKPFAFSELLARIKALSRRPKQVKSHELSLRDLTLNVSNAQVTRAGKPIALSKKEYALFEYLLRNQGQVFSAEHLLEAVWQYDSDALPNTVQVYIGYLRNKIDRAFPTSKPLIHTVRGFGSWFQTSNATIS